MDAVALDRVREGAHHVLLADDLVESLRAVAAIERRLAGHRAESTGEPDARQRAFPRYATLSEMSSEDLLDHGRRIAELERKVSELYKRLGQAEPSGFTFASDEPASVSAEEDPRLLAAIDAGNEIQAIKLYRELTGAGLGESKDAVERIASMRQQVG